MYKYYQTNVYSQKQAVFKKFTRKSFAVFNSLKLIIKISCLGFTYSLIISPIKAASNDSDTNSITKVVELEEVELVGQSPVLFEELPRMVEVVHSAELLSSPSQNIADQLRYTSNVDIRQRGIFGIQTDISFRGGSFDHSMVLLNGINITDPQTGHLSLNLPLEKETIQKIEILNGASSRINGANAFTGAINLVSGPKKYNMAAVNISYGQYKFINGAATLNIKKGISSNLLHAGYSGSDGYIENTDFSTYWIYLHNQMETDYGILNIQFGLNSKAYGANGFYSSQYPEQFEENRLTFGSLSYKTGEKVHIETKIWWRRHRDRFELFREGKNWYRYEDNMIISNRPDKTLYDSITWWTDHNHHITDAFGVSTTFSLPSKIGITSLGLNLLSSSIISNNIGLARRKTIPVRGYNSSFYDKQYSRQNADLFLEQTFNFKKLFISSGALVNWNSELPDEVNLFPGMDISYNVYSPIRLIGSYNYALGFPTFTDLFYHDLTNKGNPDLQPYGQHSIEGGLKLTSPYTGLKMVFFQTYGKNIIDWLWYPEKKGFYPLNVETYISNGIEASIHITGASGSIFESLRTGYSYINLKKNLVDSVSKYAHLKHKAFFMLQHRLFWNLHASWNFTFQDRQGYLVDYNFENNNYSTISYKPYSLIDLRIVWRKEQFQIYVEGTNLLNTQYIDVGSIYQPGRWIRLGIRSSFNNF